MSTRVSAEADVLVVGGGPGGSALATLLARTGLTVTLAEPGDFSPYTLRLVASSTDARPPTGFDPVLASVRWYGADGIAQSSTFLTRPAAVAFAEAVGFPAPLFGLDPSAQEKWQPLAARIKAKTGTDPDAFHVEVVYAKQLVWHATPAGT